MTLFITEEATCVEARLYESLEKMMPFPGDNWKVLCAPRDSVISERYRQLREGTFEQHPNEGRIFTWHEDVDPTEDELREIVRRRYVSGRVGGNSFDAGASAPRRSNRGVEMHDIAGFAQDADGALIPREGWDWDRYNAVVYDEQGKAIPTEVIPTADNPGKDYLLEARRSPAFNRVRNWLMQKSMREADE